MITNVIRTDNGVQNVFHVNWTTDKRNRLNVRSTPGQENGHETRDSYSRL